MHPEDHMVPHTSSQEQNICFSLLIPVTSHVKLTNDGPVLRQLPWQASGNTKMCLIMVWQKIAVSSPYINVYNFFFHYYNRHTHLQCNYHLIVTTLFVNPAAITLSCLYTERKKLYLNSATALCCNLNRVSITRSIIIVFIKKHCLHFENLNVHLVSHHILIS